MEKIISSLYQVNEPASAIVLRQQMIDKFGHVVEIISGELGNALKLTAVAGLK